MSDDLKMLSPEEIIDKLSKLTYARIEDQIVSGKEIYISKFVGFDLTGEFVEIPVTHAEKQFLCYGIENGYRATKTTDEIRERCGFYYPFDEFNTFKTTCNNFQFNAFALKYDNHLGRDDCGTKLRIESWRQKDFDQSFFLEGNQNVKKSSEKVFPLVQGIRGFSNQKICLTKDRVTEDLRNQVKLEAEKLTSLKEIITAQFRKDKNREKFNEQIEDANQNFAKKKKAIYQDVKYAWRYNPVFSQADYVCGTLEHKEVTYGENMHATVAYLKDWFIISKGFRALISMIKWPEIFKPTYEKFRPLDRPENQNGTNPVNEDKYAEFEMDMKDILSGNQNIISNTFRKHQLLAQDYKNKKSNSSFKAKILQKIRDSDSIQQKIGVRYEIKDDEYLKNDGDFDDKFLFDVAKTYFPDDLENLQMDDDQNEQFKSIYKNIRTEQFTKDHIHTIAALMMVLVFKEKAFRADGKPKQQILYQDSFVHSTWDIPDWIRGALTDEKDLYEPPGLSWHYY